MTIYLDRKINDQAVTWYAIVCYYRGMQEEVYRLGSQNNIEPLYLDTVLSSLLAESPLVIQLKPDLSLASHLPKSKMLLLAAPAKLSFQEVIDDLRLKLSIRFSGDQQGLFHYYSPSVYSYFLNALSTQDTDNWLGLFMTAKFYCQKFRQHAQWQASPISESKASSNIWSITPSQEVALTQMVEDKAVDNWRKFEKLSKVNWSQQHAVSQFCAQHHIEDEQRTFFVRNIFHKWDVSPDILNFNPHVIINLPQEEKITQLESTLARNTDYGR